MVGIQRVGQSKRKEAFSRQGIVLDSAAVQHIDAEMQVQRSPGLLVGMRGGVDLPEAPIHGFSEFLHLWIV